MLLNCGIGEDLRVPWTARISNQSLLKEINLEYSLEGLMLKLQYFGNWCKELTHWKRPWCWERLRARGEGDNRGWDIGWHHWVNGYESEQTPGASEGQRSLVCCSPWGHKELDIIEWLENNLNIQNVCPFLLLESLRPFVPSSGAPDFLSTCLGIDSLTST